METGSVKFFNDQKGYGFIVVDGSNREVFVHVTGLVDEIKEGDTVKFDIQDGKKGPNAINVQRA